MSRLSQYVPTTKGARQSIPIPAPPKINDVLVAKMVSSAPYDVLKSPHGREIANAMVVRRARYLGCQIARLDESSESRSTHRKEPPDRDFPNRGTGCRDSAQRFRGHP